MEIECGCFRLKIGTWPMVILAWLGMGVAWAWTFAELGRRGYPPPWAMATFRPNVQAAGEKRD